MCELLGTMASLSLAPVNIFKAGADEERAETARLVSLFLVLTKIEEWFFVCFTILRLKFMLVISDFYSSLLLLEPLLLETW